MRTLATLSVLAAAACSRDAAPPAATPATATAVDASASRRAAAPGERKVPTTSASPEAPSLFLEAERVYYDTNVTVTIAKLKAALAADPSYPRALLRMAQYQDSAERPATFARIRAGLHKLPELERRWIETRINGFEDRGERPNNELLAIAEAAPDDWEVQMAAAELTQFHYDKPIEARKYLDRAIAVAPTWAAPYNLLAYSHAAEGNSDRAIEAITRYAELAPGAPNPLDSKGEILLEAGRLDDAEVAFRSALALEPTFQSADGVAVVQLHRGDLATSLAGFERAWKSQAYRAGARWSLGSSLLWVYLIDERYAQALALTPELEKTAADTGHRYPQAYGHIFRARVELHREQWRDALAHLELARAVVAGQSDEPAARLLQTIRVQSVRALVGMKDLAQAERTLAELVSTNPDDDLTRVASLVVAHHKGDLAAAKAAGKPLFGDHQYGAEAKLLVADLLAGAGHADKAKALREAVAQTYRRDPRSYLLRQRALRALKKT